MRFLVVILLCYTTTTLVGQDVSTIANPQQTERDSIRAYYIKKFPDYFFIYPVIKKRSLNFEIEKDGSENNLLTYKPNNAYSLGLGLYLFEFNFELAFAVPLDQQSQEIYGKSKARDIQFNLLGKKWGLDLFYQRYNGFYITESGVSPDADTPLPQRSDIVTNNVGLTGHYIVDNSRFSFRSSYNFAERQLYSKGSLLMFGGLSSFKLNADSSIITSEQQTKFGANVAFENLRYTTFSLAPGYTYSMVFKNFFLNGTLAVGPAHHWILYKTENSADRNETSVNSFIAARIAMGYNGERIFGGISFITQGSNVRFEDIRFSNNNGTFKILIGYRLNELGFLRKRVWDLIPFKI
ncbi:DUF4421 family protein [Chryseosolibacter indicus]|uniref:DUF4421 family protein n=1 Tax=Chryseosolibacter indicus TaxID=2782351 RepID=A0ABS5VTT0_9BACT|nr:DUF4421 family protein [Chryseosolibacter indicus]MBT1704179.1 DUF4421 family protein [Chryseosolibacter indicus]